MNRFFSKAKKAGGLAAVAAIAALSVAACDQSPIFNSISNETKKSEALITGTPSRIVKVGTHLYVANGYLWKREAIDGTGPWNKTNRPAGSSHKVRNLEAIGTVLYALTVEDDDKLNDNETTTAVWSSSDGGATWTQIGLDAAVSSYSVDSLYSANGKLFVSAKAPDSSKNRGFAWGMLVLNGAALEGVVTGLDDGGMFVGAAHDGAAYYLASSEYGIYRTTDLATVALMPSTAAITLKGIAAVGQGATKSVIAVCGYPDGDDTLVQLAGNTGFSAKDQNLIFSGGIAEYHTDSDGLPDYLLLGIKSGNTYGYREIALSGGELTNDQPGLSKPNSASTTVDYDQYAGSLGVVPVQNLFQSREGAADILYASSDLEGLWSSVNRGDWDLVDD